MTSEKGVEIVEAKVEEVDVRWKEEGVEGDLKSEREEEEEGEERKREGERSRKNLHFVMIFSHLYFYLINDINFIWMTGLF